MGSRGAEGDAAPLEKYVKRERETLLAIVFWF